MGTYTDINAPCATVTKTGPNGEKIRCGHYVADHTWKDPIEPPKPKPYPDADGITRLDYDEYNDRFAEFHKDLQADHVKARNDAALDRGKCHVSGCACVTYLDPATLTDAERVAAVKAVPTSVLDKNALAEAYAEGYRRAVAEANTAKADS